MKLGILTLPPSDNYGGILQAAALYEFLTTLGHNVVLIYKSPDTKPYDFVSACKATTKRLLLYVPFYDFRNVKANKAKRLEAIKGRAFHRSLIEAIIPNISPPLYTKDDLTAFAKKEHLDAVVVGSDQVWRKLYINDRHYQSFFLDFVDSKTCSKIAYAASFGSDQWEGVGDSDRIGQLLADFTAVSTRESTGVDICRRTFGYSGAVHVLDPTLIVDKDFYVTHILKKHLDKNFNASGVVTYVLDEAEEKAAIIRRAMSAIDGKSIMHLKAFESTGYVYTVPEWLASFHNADFIITDSFHGMVFSIIFEKDFIVIGNEKRGMERFTSLLSQLGLINRLVLSTSDLKASLFDPINYTTVNAALLPLKEYSRNFLLRALNKH